MYLALHYLVGLAPMQSDEVASSTSLRVALKAKSHSTMAHYLGNVGFVLAAKTLLMHT